MIRATPRLALDMPFVREFRACGLIQQLLRISESQLIKLTRDVFTDDTLEEGEFATLSAGAIGSQCREFISRVIVSNQIPIPLLQAAVSHFKSFSNLPGFIEMLTLQDQCSKAFYVLAGLEAIAPGTPVKDVINIQVVEKIFDLVLTLLKSSTDAELRNGFVRHDCLGRVIVELGRQLDLVKPDDEKPKAAITAEQSLFITGPWVHARCIEHGDNVFTLTPVSNASTTVNADGAITHAGFKSTATALQVTAPNTVQGII